MRAETASRMTPTSRASLHVAHSTRVVGKRSRQKITAVKIAPLARAPFWAWPNNVSRLCVAQVRGLLSVYKSRGAPFYPFTCARIVGAAPTATLSRAGEGSRGEAKGTRRSETTPRPETPKSKRARWTPRARPLPGWPPRPRQEPCRDNLPKHQRSEPPLSPQVPTQPTTIGPGLGRHLCGGMQIFVKTTDI